jgi:serine-type D-Ala-D-Ala endopeptidase (penicillin-binding protein 7)
MQHALRGRLWLAIGLLVWGSLAGEALARKGKAKSPWIKRRDKRGRMIVVDINVPPLTRDGRPNVQAKAAIMIDLESGNPLFEKNADEQRPIASISKTFAAMVVMDRKLELDKVTTVIEEDQKFARGGAKSRLLMGRAYTNLDILHAMMMGSDNRAVTALGRATGLAPADLVAAMNAKARALGLRHTAFEDPVGLSNGNMSTPRDLVLAIRAMLKYPLLSEISGKKEHDVFTADGKPRASSHYVNTDQVARAGRYRVLAGKTGYTDEARYCLVIAAKVGDRTVAAAILGAEGELTRFADFNRAAAWLVDDGPSKVAAKAVLAARKQQEHPGGANPPAPAAPAP